MSSSDLIYAESCLDAYRYQLPGPTQSEFFFSSIPPPSAMVNLGLKRKMPFYSTPVFENLPRVLT
jgi:hypothetical protein